MAWNQPGDEQQGKPRGSGARPAGGASGWRRLRQRWNANPQARKPLLAAAAGLALLVWLSSGLYQIDDGERGVLQRFGAFAGLVDSGAGWHLPWPIESLTVVNVDQLHSVDLPARMFTADVALVNVTTTLQYRYQDARAAAFAVREPDALVRALGEAATRRLVGQRRLVDLLGGAVRVPLSQDIRVAVQATLDRLHSGLQLSAVNLTDLNVPEAVLAAQHDFVLARQEKELKAREAQGYAADLVPAAQGVAQRQRLEAEAYKTQTVGLAEGDAARFDPLVAVYARAPEVTRSRLYIETIETILARSRKVIIDGKGGGNSLVLPLDKLIEAGAPRGAGVVGAVAAAPAATTAQSAAPSSATPAAAAPVADAVPAVDGAVRDERSRERGERN